MGRLLGHLIQNRGLAHWARRTVLLSRNSADRKINFMYALSKRKVTFVSRTDECTYCWPDSSPLSAVSVYLVMDLKVTAS